MKKLSAFSGQPEKELTAYGERLTAKIDRSL
jgi:hypothetical protein